MAKARMTQEEKEFWRKLGDKTRAARKRRKLTQETVADMLKMSRPSLANIEAGRQTVDVYTFWRLSTVLEFKD